MKYRLYFPDGDWFEDADGVTEFNESRCRIIEGILYPYVTLERRVWP